MAAHRRRAALAGLPAQGAPGEVEEEMSDHLRLERMKLVVLQYLTNELADVFAEPPEVSVHETWMDEIVLRVQQAVWGREVARVEYQWPANWWEAVKERFAPAWVKRRWPIHYSRVELTADEVVPFLAFGRENGSAIVTHRIEHPWHPPSDWEDD